MKRQRERLEGRIDAEQMDHLYWLADKHGISRNEALRKVLDENPEYKTKKEEISKGTDIGRQYRSDATTARRTLSRK